MDSPALTWAQLKLAHRVCQINERSGRLESGTVTADTYELTIAWDSAPSSPVAYRSFSFDPSQTPIYLEGCPMLALAMEWGRQVLMVKALHYRPDLLLKQPDVLPLLQQIRELIGDQEISELVSRYQSMSAIPKGQRVLDVCIPHLPRNTDD